MAPFRPSRKSSRRTSPVQRAATAGAAPGIHEPVIEDSETPAITTPQEWDEPPLDRRPTYEQAGFSKQAAQLPGSLFKNFSDLNLPPNPIKAKFRPRTLPARSYLSVSTPELTPPMEPAAAEAQEESTGQFERAGTEENDEIVPPVQTTEMGEEPQEPAPLLDPLTPASPGSRESTTVLESAVIDKKDEPVNASTAIVPEDLPKVNGVASVADHPLPIENFVAQTSAPPSTIVPPALPPLNFQHPSINNPFSSIVNHPPASPVNNTSLIHSPFQPSPITHMADPNALAPWTNRPRRLFQDSVYEACQKLKQRFPSRHLQLEGRHERALTDFFDEAQRDPETSRLFEAIVTGSLTEEQRAAFGRKYKTFRDARLREENIQTRALRATRDSSAPVSRPEPHSETPAATSTIVAPVAAPIPPPSPITTNPPTLPIVPPLGSFHTTPSRPKSSTGDLTRASMPRPKRAEAAVTTLSTPNTIPRATRSKSKPISQTTPIPVPNAQPAPEQPSQPVSQPTSQPNSQPASEQPSQAVSEHSSQLVSEQPSKPASQRPSRKSSAPVTPLAANTRPKRNTRKASDPPAEERPSKRSKKQVPAETTKLSDVPAPPLGSSDDTTIPDAPDVPVNPASRSRSQSSALSSVDEKAVSAGPPPSMGAHGPRLTRQEAQLANQAANTAKAARRYENELAARQADFPNGNQAVSEERTLVAPQPSPRQAQPTAARRVTRSKAPATGTSTPRPSRREVTPIPVDNTPADSALGGRILRKRRGDHSQGTPTVPAVPPSARASQDVEARPAKKQKTGARVITSPVKHKHTSAGISNSRPANGHVPPPNFRPIPAGLVDDDAISIDSELSDYESDDICQSCGDGGDLVCCDGRNCPHALHKHCCDPPFSENDPRLEDPFYCPECEQKQQERVQTEHKDQLEKSGTFKVLYKKMLSKNPSAFQLTHEIRTYYVGVLTKPNGEYGEELVPKVPVKARQPNPLTIPVGDLFPAEDKSIEYESLRETYMRCYHCTEDSQRDGRIIAQCDYCPAQWHLDCLDPPQAAGPVEDADGKNRLQFRCPLHDENDVLLSGPGFLERKRRHPKQPVIVRPTFQRGNRNGGVIVVESDWEGDDDGLGPAEGVVYKLAPRAVHADFVSKAKRYAAEQLLKKAAAVVNRPPAPASALVSESQLEAHIEAEVERRLAQRMAALQQGGAAVLGGERGGEESAAAETLLAFNRQ
ncbi:hypothetical protein BT63DRAFT_453459 [Microthyrium microscopicum]|uniref:PHD-type domain-containing protein n=1 Tax=Microthyrium microscopicum TaxID=703497 RepID=A0A6A6UHB3_9PEZI|nr:hypothetical protein BT63DRAFT_453459 [Microthyrium microscopicum]